jgi:multidrug efflux pump
MTTLATILGAIPLALATGAGAAGRQQIGYVIITGLGFSTLLTLFIVPALYVVLAGKEPALQPAEVEHKRRLSPLR